MIVELNQFMIVKECKFTPNQLDEVRTLAKQTNKVALETGGGIHVSPFFSEKSAANFLVLLNSIIDN